MELQNQLENKKNELSHNYHISEIYLFGSYIKGKAKPESDVDILVSFSEPISLFKFIELEDYLTEMLGIKVDLVSKKALKPRIGSRILKEAVAI